MKKPIDLNTWSRKHHFAFFSQFREPFFGLTVHLNCGKAYDFCKSEGHSFFLYYLHKTLVAVNDIEPFRYRIIDNAPFVYDRVDASPTINRPDGSFGFGYITYYPDFAIFQQKASAEISRVRATNELIPALSGENVIHFSALPWVNFTALSHARPLEGTDSSPKIAVGKMTGEGASRTMPVSIHVHHAMMDGYDVGKFVDRFQQLLESV